jgi:hypothetical protein
LTTDDRWRLSHPYVVCPSCGKRACGVLDVSRDQVSDFVKRGCAVCKTRHVFPLPRVRKRVIYIDQLGVSNMMRVVESELQREGHHSGFFRQLFIQLLRLVHLQAVVCPQSRTHEQESALSPRLEPALLAVLRSVSGGVRFDYPSRVEHASIVPAALAWQAGEPFVFDRTAPWGVFTRRVHTWMPHPPFAINERWSAEDVAKLRECKKGGAFELGPFYRDWQQQPAPLGELLASAGDGKGAARLKMFAQRMNRTVSAKAAAQAPDPDDIKAEAHCPVWPVMEVFVLCGMKVLDAWARVQEFFTSSAILQVPSWRIHSLLDAFRRHEVQHSTKGPDKADEGNPFDFGAISTVLPYSDAMFVDKKCAHYLRQIALAEEAEKYGCRIFSLANRDEFLQYLRGLEAAVSAQQRMHAELTYGPLPTEVPKLF